MGDGAISGLDHVLVGVRDLEGARAAYARLGFTATPRGRHIGWATANYCLMFPDDYVELIGIVDGGGFTNDLDRFLARREGLMGVALASADAEATHAGLAARGLAAGEPTDLARDLELPEGTVRPRFRLVHLAEGASPGIPAFVCQHRSPALVRRPAWLDHANGAVGIAEVAVVVEQPAALGLAYARLFGAEAIRIAGDELRVAAGATTLAFLSVEAFAVRHPGVAIAEERPLPLGLAIAVSDLGRARALLEAGGVAHRAEAGRLRIAPEAACGVALSFIPA